MKSLSGSDRHDQAQATLRVNNLTTEAPPTRKTAPPTSFVVSFAPEDRAFKNELCKHLALSLQGRQFKIWTSDDAIPGDDGDSSFRAALAGADTAIILISADFLASKTAQTVDVPTLLEHGAKSRIRLVPVIVRSCNWKADAKLGKLNSLPAGGKPISAYKGSARDKIYQEIADELADIGARLAAAPADGGDAAAKATPSDPEQLGGSPSRMGSSAPGGRGTGTLRLLAAFFGAATLFFLMFLVIKSTDGKTVPCGARFIVVAVFALGLGLSAAFVTGDAAIRGQLPIPRAKRYPLEISAGGGLAALMAILAVGYPSYVNRPECNEHPPDPVSTAAPVTAAPIAPTPLFTQEPAPQTSYAASSTTAASQSVPSLPSPAKAGAARKTAAPSLPAKPRFKCSYFRMIGQTKIPNHMDLAQDTADSARAACAALCAESMGTQVECKVSNP